MLILASASPRRHELLLAARIEHIVRPAHISETKNATETPQAYVQRIAADKAQAISANDSEVVLGADTVVCVEDTVLGKPGVAQEAARMLRLLSGREHTVLTGIALRQGSRLVTGIEETRVWFDEISDQEIAEYIETGEAWDKAGAYAIQGYASRFVRRIEGCYHNVVGLPVSLVYRHLKSL
jgi:septum formation protein